MTTPPPLNFQQPAHPSQIPQKVVRQPKTKIIFYNSERAMQKGIIKEQQRGWEYVSSEVIDQGYGFFKTCFLGCLFLPLALLGRKRKHIKVVYSWSSD